MVALGAALREMHSRLEEASEMYVQLGEMRGNPRLAICMLHVPHYSNLHLKIHKLIAVKNYYFLTVTLAPDPTSALYYSP